MNSSPEAHLERSILDLDFNGHGNTLIDCYVEANRVLCMLSDRLLLIKGMSMDNRIPV